MTITQYLLREWWLVLIAFVSALLFLFLPLVKRRFSPSSGLNTLEATRLMNAGGTMIIDVREEAEFASGHIGRAVNIPLSTLEARLPDLQKKATKTFLVYCERGTRSLKAAKILATTQKTIHNLAGGMAAWRAANLPVEKSEKPEKAEKSAAAKPAPKNAKDTKDVKGA